MLGSTDVPTVAAFMQAFEQQHYKPKLFIAAAGPDQGGAFTSVVGTGNAAGMMVPDGWYPGYANAQSKKMVREYVAQYGGTASSVNADVAEAYSVGQVIAQAVTATGGTDNAKIIKYLHGDVSLNTVQGPVKFDALGENGAAATFIFQWQNGSFSQVLPSTDRGPARSSPPSRPGPAETLRLFHVDITALTTEIGVPADASPAPSSRALESAPISVPRGLRWPGMPVMLVSVGSAALEKT